MKTVAIVPAKEISERVPGKNRLVFDGDFLFVRKIRQLLETEGVDEVYLDTESDELAALVKSLPVKRLIRPKSLASNATDGHELFAWEASQLPDADIYIQALCTAPFVTADTIGRALKDLKANPEADSLVAIRTKREYFWTNGAPTYGTGRIPNSVDLLPTMTEGMSLYMVKRPEGASPPTKRFGKNPVLFPLNSREDIDINTSDDLALAYSVVAGDRAKLASELATISNFISTPLISDVCNELGHHAALPPEIRLLAGRRVVGLAKTISLRAITAEDQPDAWRGIFETLQIYDFVQQGDVILIATDVPEKAFFGDLNASLALRAGAVGAVVDGATRDIAAVRDLGLSVFARNSYYDDIRYFGSMRSIGEEITIGNARISPADIIIGDEDGVAFVPRALWSQVRAAVIESFKREWSVRAAVLEGVPAPKILDLLGDF